MIVRDLDQFAEFILGSRQCLTIELESQTQKLNVVKILQPAIRLSEQHHRGIRITMEARLENARIPIQVDIGFGDAVTPDPEEVQFPVLLDLPAA